jgi:hypothetical protein
MSKTYFLFPNCFKAFKKETEGGRKIGGLISEEVSEL